MKFLGAEFLSSVGLGLGTRIGRAQLLPTPALDKNWLPTTLNGLGIRQLLKVSR